MSEWGYQRRCAEILTQTDLLYTAMSEARMEVAVPTCPGWDLAELVRHLGGAHRRTAEMVRARATTPPVDPSVYEADDDIVYSPYNAATWLAEGSSELGDTLRAAGPDAAVWTPVRNGTASFWATRLLCETVIHRADADIALGNDVRLENDVAAVSIDDWLELSSYPEALEAHPDITEIFAPDRTVHLHATDTPPELNAEWFIDLSGDTVTWRREHGKATAALRAPVTDLLLVLYGRLPLTAGTVEVRGDGDVARLWLDRLSQWLRRA